MMIGDLVRVQKQTWEHMPDVRLSLVPAHLDFALVVAVRAAWPNEPRETELKLDVVYPDGREETWYDSQLEVVSENTGA